MTGKISEKSATDNFQINSLELDQEETNVGVDSELYCDAYRELADLIGANNTKKIWEHYHGLTIQFPQRLYSRTYSKEFIRQNMEEMTIKQMATQLSLTDRRVRQIIKELRRDEQ